MNVNWGVIAMIGSFYKTPYRRRGLGIIIVSYHKSPISISSACRSQPRPFAQRLEHLTYIYSSRPPITPSHSSSPHHSPCHSPYSTARTTATTPPSPSPHSNPAHPAGFSSGDESCLRTSASYLPSWRGVRGRRSSVSPRWGAWRLSGRGGRLLRP